MAGRPALGETRGVSRGSFLDSGLGLAYAIAGKRQKVLVLMATYEFKKFFTVEDAVEWLPWVVSQLKQAHAELRELQDGVILSKRLLLARKNSGRQTSDAEVMALQKRFEGFEEAVQRWVDRFAEQGIILREIETGLIDFPYRAERSGDIYFLCWRLKEDGIFYFHGLNEGFSGRHPITLLPE